MIVSNTSARSKVTGKATVGFILLIVAAAGAAALAIVLVLALSAPLWGVVVLVAFPLVVFLGLLVSRRRGYVAPSLMHFCARPVMSAVVSIYTVLGIMSVFTYFGGPEIVGYILANPAKAELQFEYKLCPEDNIFRGSAPPPTIQWEATSTARISAIAEANCGTSWLFGDYAVKGDIITLEYQAIVSRYYLCDCAHQVSYRILDIPRRDYIVEVHARPEIYARLWLWKPLLGLVEDK
jgi:hypothetical protein